MLKDLKNALVVCACIVVLSVAGIAIYTVRDYLPLVGILLLVLLLLVACGGVALGIEFVIRRFYRVEHKAIDQYGTISRRYNSVEVYAPYHAPVRTRERFIEELPTSLDELPIVEDMPALVPPVPTFKELLETGQVQSAIAQGKMLLGYYAETHELRLGSWLDLYSAGNGGVSGSGKSTTTRFLLFQAALAGAKFLMIDPHIGDPDESLSYQFSLLPTSIHQMKPCDGQASNVMKRVRYLAGELEKRKRTGIKTPPLVYVIDEFNSIIRHLGEEERKELTKLLLDIEQEGRKFGIFALLIGQRWSAQDLGGADIRTSLASKMAHRFSDEDQAKRFIGSKWGKVLLELSTGHWIFYDTKGQYNEMITPETNASDGAIIASLISPGASSATSVTASNASIIASSFPALLSPGVERDVATDVALDAVTEPLELSGEAEIVLTMLREKRGQNEIIEHVWGVKSSGGSAYRKAVEEYRAIVALLVARIGA